MNHSYFRKKFIAGFSLVELLLVGTMISGLGLVIMQMNKNILKTTGDATSNSDLLQLKADINALLSDNNTCTASFAGKTFMGMEIRNYPVIDMSLWSVDQNGAKNKNIIYSNLIYGKLIISGVTFSMPDYTAGVNFSPGTNQSFKGELKIAGYKVNFGSRKAFTPIIISLTVIFDTNVFGQSTIVSCYRPGTQTPAATPTTQSIDWY